MRISMNLCPVDQYLAAIPIELRMWLALILGGVAVMILPYLWRD